MIEVGGSKSLCFRAFPSNLCISDAKTSSRACGISQEHSSTKEIRDTSWSSWSFRSVQWLVSDLQKRQSAGLYTRTCSPSCFLRDGAAPVPFDPKNVGRLLWRRRCQGRGGDDVLCSSVNSSMAAFGFVFLNLPSLPSCLVLSSAILLHSGPLSAFIWHHLSRMKMIVESIALCFLRGGNFAVAV